LFFLKEGRQIVKKQKSVVIILGSILVLGLIITLSCSASGNDERLSSLDYLGAESSMANVSAIGDQANRSTSSQQLASICSAPNRPIPDKGTLIDTITVPDTGVLSDLDVYLDIQHTYVGDLTITLIHTDNSGPASLIDRLGCGGSDIDVTINDEGPDGNVISQCEDAPAIHGNRVGGNPAGPVLSAFDGNEFVGEWVLTIKDNNRGDQGTLVKWCLIPSMVVPCYSLTLDHTGQGADPIASLTNSVGCPAGQYVAGGSISLSGAIPNPGWQIGSWSGTGNNASKESTNIVTMPANAHTATVNFIKSCYSLTLGHTGQGTDPIASPASSDGCPAGQYVAGGSISLSGAIPNPGWQIGSWSGTDNDASTESSNTVTMPANTLTAIVNYLTSPPACTAGTFIFTGNFEYIGTFSMNGVNVNVSGWSRDKSPGDFAPADFLVYPEGLGVTDFVSDGDGSNDQHTLDNHGAYNYLLFEFDQPVTIDQIYLGYVVSDSDITVWFGNAPGGVDPFTNHQTLNDEFLSTLAFENNPGNNSVRWADINGSNQMGNILVVAAKIGDANDYIKVNKLKIICPN
jgi:subtilisin-like proprotein convertase family protein